MIVLTNESNFLNLGLGAINKDGEKSPADTSSHDSSSSPLSSIEDGKAASSVAILGSQPIGMLSRVSEGCTMRRIRISDMLDFATSNRIFVPALLVALYAVFTGLPQLPFSKPGSSDVGGDDRFVNGVYNYDTTFCNLERRTVAPHEWGQVQGKLPIIIVKPTNNTEMSAVSSKSALLKKYGDVPVVLASSNTYSSDKRTTTMREYVETMMVIDPLNSKSNETWYLFGDNHGGIWNEILESYRTPPYPPSDVSALSFGIGGRGSGVPFHFHGPGYSETLHGRKRWFLYPPADPVTFHPDQHQAAWLRDVYPSLEAHQLPYECTIMPGEVLYFPSKWLHATLNLDAYTSFVSTFSTEEPVLEQQQQQQ